MQVRLFFTFIIFFIYQKNFAQQGNYKFNNYGNSSILLSGNVTGSVEDIALTYYNPARLTELESTKFSFNAQAYQYSSFKLTDLAGDQSTVSDKSFDGIPSLAGGTFNLFNTRFAYSFLSKTRNDIGLNYAIDFNTESVLGSLSEVDESMARVKLYSKTKDEWIGLTWAKKVNEKLSLGVSGFVSIYNDRGETNLNNTIKQVDGSVALYNNGKSYKIESYGLFMKIGANYHFSKFDLGLNMNLPYLEVYNTGQYNYSKVIAGVGVGIDEFFDYEFKDLSVERKEPLGLSIGAGVPFGKSKVHLNIDYIAGLSAYNRISVPEFDTGKEEPTTILFEEKRNGVLNFGFGVEVFVNEKMTSYISFSSDYNSIENNEGVFDLSDNGEINNSVNENFMHLGMGIDWDLSWGDIVFGTTYTHGAGNFDKALNPVNNADNDELIGLKYNRWQFIVGLEIPFLNDKLKEVKSK